MKKLTALLNLVAIAASVLFVSCAQKKEPDLVPAFPSHKYASYSFSSKNNAYTWTFESTYSYTAAKGCGFRVNTANSAILDYIIDPNTDWTASVVGDACDYIEVRYGFGYSDENYTYGSSVSGDRGMQTIGFRIKKQPEWNEEAKKCDIALTMGSETMIIATLTLDPGQKPAETPEESEEGGEWEE